VPSIREYVLIAQDRQRVEVYRRESADAWSVEVCGEGESVHLASVGVTVEVSALYVRRA
jgi:Uma2 family endonuclease